MATTPMLDSVKIFVVEMVPGGRKVRGQHSVKTFVVEMAAGGRKVRGQRVDGVCETRDSGAPFFFF